ncbi:hypothetical protein Bhyg_13525, partial [Pseudolycoriella hygida]
SANAALIASSASTEIMTFIYWLTALCKQSDKNSLEQCAPTKPVPTDESFLSSEPTFRGFS